MTAPLCAAGGVHREGGKPPSDRDGAVFAAAADLRLLLSASVRRRCSRSLWAKQTCLRTPPADSSSPAGRVEAHGLGKEMTQCTICHIYIPEDRRGKPV